MKVNEVNKLNYSQNKTSFNGKFVKLSFFNPAEQVRIDNFIKHSYQGKTNRAVLSSKPYNIYFLKDKGNIIMNTFYERPYLEEPQPCYISTLDEDLEKSSISFRNSLKWYQSYKKEYGYFNGFWEKLRTYIYQ